MTGDASADYETGEIVATVASIAPTPRVSSSLVTIAAPVATIERAFHDYQQLCGRLLDDTDVQRIGKRDFRKKSAWRKLAVAFGVSCEILDRSYERAGRAIIRAEVIVRATAPNGRFMDGLGACDLFEKCCPADCRNGSQHHTHCTADCSGAIHFSNPNHDLPATAATRATNRACADLFGMGEVSAEEITSSRAAVAVDPPADDDTIDELDGVLAALDPADAAGVRDWWRSQRFPNVRRLTPAQVGQVWAELENRNLLVDGAAGDDFGEVVDPPARAVNENHDNGDR